MVARAIFSLLQVAGKSMSIGHSLAYIFPISAFVIAVSFLLVFHHRLRHWIFKRLTDDLSTLRKIAHLNDLFDTFQTTKKTKKSPPGPQVSDPDKAFIQSLKDEVSDDSSDCDDEKHLCSEFSDSSSKPTSSKPTSSRPIYSMPIYSGPPSSMPDPSVVIPTTALSSIAIPSVAIPSITIPPNQESSHSIAQSLAPSSSRQRFLGSVASSGDQIATVD